MAPVAELLVDRYELGVRLGSGGMGDVYRAHDRLLERVVAVKVPTTTITPASAERFKREARAAARLNHPNVVGVYDWGGGTEPFLVMEFVEGRSLRAELRACHTLPPTEVAAVGAQIADALAHAHHHGVVHRDVKPSNVLLTPGGSVKVTDFGIAQSAAGEALTEPGVVLGTVGYLSPEQVAGLPADARSDIYSLGVVLTELLTGERPTGHAADGTTELDRVIARARAADPSARYQSAAELRDSLRSLSGVESTGDVGAAAPITAPAVTVDTDATARATGHAVTSVLPAAVAGTALTVPPRTKETPEKRRRFRRTKAPAPKLTKMAKPVKPMKPPKPKRRSRKGAAPNPAPVAAAVCTPVRTRTWKARHWAVLLAAPLVVIVGGVVAYARFTERAPSVAVPDVVYRDAFTAAAVMQKAGFEVDVRATDDPLPAGTILAQRPTNGHKLEQGSTVVLTVARADARVPYVATKDIEAAKAVLAGKGFQNLAITPDYRNDVDPGTVMRTSPTAFSKSRKADSLEVVVAADPRVKLPEVVGLDRDSATSQLQALGLDVVVQTASSRSKPVGQVVKSNPGAGDTVVRGDTITLTVSSGPKQVSVPDVVGWDRDDAANELEDRGLVVAYATVAASGDQVDTVVSQNPAGGQVAEGSTVTLAVGVKAKKG